MGNDGGSIPKRRELVKEAARAPTSSELKATALESLTHAWTTCRISSAPLDPHNTVADARGQLYNYETILRCLLPGAADPTTGGEGEGEERQTQEAAAFARSGIRSLKDVVKLRFNIRKDDGKREVRTCPVSMRELGGAATRAVYVVPCGHVFAEAIMKELLATEAEEKNNKGKDTTDAADNKMKMSRCPECSEAFALRDMVPILPVDEPDVEKCAARSDELRTLGLAHNLKKDKSAGGKKKKRKATEEEDGGGGAPVESGKDGERERESRSQKEGKKKQKRDRDDISSRINNSMTATLTAKVLAEQDERNRQRKLAAAVR
ncbi:Rtf2 RING-finger-domain-containing protein [Nemania sp. FL0916]|nr:Rtf2 RING-finger-domain-containing protein [Nemania sp. FL0916]